MTLRVTRDLQALERRRKQAARLFAKGNLPQAPGYAPDLNPTEAVWNNIKGRELANFCADQIEEADNAFRTGLRRVAHTLQLPFSFLKHAGLSF